MRRLGLVTAGTAILLATAAIAGASSGRESGPPPITIDGVQLTFTVPPIVKRACRDAQKHVVVRVVCPAIVPRGPIFKHVGLYGPMWWGNRVWLITFNNGDLGPKYLHWMVGAGRWPEVRRYLLGDFQNEVKGVPRRITRERRHGLIVDTYLYPMYPAGGPNGGHVASFVSCGPQAIIASVHGKEHAELTRALALALAKRAGCFRFAKPS